MDESKVRPGLPGDRSQAAAEKLRALRERADTALEGHRSRLGEIETKLSERVRLLAEEFGATLGAATQAAGQTHEEEVAALRRQIEDGNAKHDKFVEQLMAARQQLDAIESQPCASCQQAAQQLATAEEESERLREELDAAIREHQEDRQRHEKFVEQLAAARQAITVLQHAAGETSNELRSDLEECRAEKAATEDQLAAAQRDLAALHGECESASDRAADAERELIETRREAASQLELTSAAESELARVRKQAETLEKQAAALREQTSTLSAQAASLDRDRGATASQYEQLRAEADDLAVRLATAEREVAAQYESAAVAANEKAALEESLTLLQSTAHTEQDAWIAEKTALTELLTAAEQELRQLRDSLVSSDNDKLQTTLSLSQAESACREYQRRLGAMETEAEALQAELAAVADAPLLREQLEAARAAAVEQAAAIAAAQAAIAQSRTELTTLREASVPRAELDAAEQLNLTAQATIAQLQAAIAAGQNELAEVRQIMHTPEDYAELQQKCDLALADLQKLKRENSGLREELAERPAASDQDSPELISLRSERDALAARVTELETEAVAAAKSGGDADQDRDDLQRRFEMAVDDVRQLKQENSKLRDRVAAAEKGGSAPAAATKAGGGGDWASQRARLMALLEEEDQTGTIASDRVAERATVASTMAATDAAIAAKDRELEELRAALATQCGADSAGATAAARDELLDGDDIVVAERERLAKLTAEFEAKLRSAELEFSVERAKLARDQAALRDRQFEMQSAPAPAPAAEGDDASKPRRRWLSALGLGDEAEDGKK